ncbi:hypothetical protein BPAE_0098g00090 [Botrytis paeoniae]|uniref:Uncharacterized protein n=1 Tax=Botrytis paeoniae TaxID=278948 RepID=A0A4Z1FM40_9HELO|nr:hypothetical protein BPAE_0098g00090 [Botrytis paeoniae]
MKLRKWLEYNDCTARWVRREAGHRYPSDVSVLAGSLVDVTMISKTPIIFHFCELIKRSEQQQGLTLEQAYEIFPFSQLEKPLESWKEALSHIIDLLNLATGVLLCVIDGLGYMDYGKAKAMCGNILAA